MWLGFGVKGGDVLRWDRLHVGECSKLGCKINTKKREKMK